MKYYSDFLRNGGQWLGNLRSRVQSMFLNGDSVTWSSHAELKPNPSIAQVEELGAYAVAGYHNEVVEPMIETMKNTRAILRGQLSVCRADDKEVIEKTINKLSVIIEGKPEFLCEKT